MKHLFSQPLPFPGIWLVSFLVTLLLPSFSLKPILQLAWLQWVGAGESQPHTSPFQWGKAAQPQATSAQKPQQTKEQLCAPFTPVLTDIPGKMHFPFLLTGPHHSDSPFPRSST